MIDYIMGSGKKQRNLKVDFTTTKVFCYEGKNLVGTAGVTDPKDFDLDYLVSIAMKSKTLEE